MRKRRSGSGDPHQQRAVEARVGRDFDRPAESLDGLFGTAERSASQRPYGVRQQIGAVGRQRPVGGSYRLGQPPFAPVQPGEDRLRAGFERPVRGERPLGRLAGGGVVAEFFERAAPVVQLEG
ncbi:MAG: hypothetical protein ABSH40_13365 [Bryobacteraceae bacterium]